jgi:hypothetical protein
MFTAEFNQIRHSLSILIINTSMVGDINGYVSRCAVPCTDSRDLSTGPIFESKPTRMRAANMDDGFDKVEKEELQERDC